MAPGAHPEEVLDPYIQNLIRHKARRLCRGHVLADSDEADVQQTLTLYLLTKLRLFDPKRASLRTFAARVVGSCIATLRRDRNCQKRRPPSPVISLDQQRGDAVEDGCAPCDQVSQGEGGRRVSRPAPNPQQALELAEAVTFALAALPPEQRTIVLRLSDGTEMGVTRELGITRHQVHRAVQHFQRQLRAAGIDWPLFLRQRPRGRRK